MEELKPCPFCGGKAELIPLQYPECYILCKKCKVEQGHIYRAKQAAIKAWNRRKPYAGR